MLFSEDTSNLCFDAFDVIWMSVLVHSQTKNRIVLFMWSINKSLSASEIRSILKQTATDLGHADFDETYGWGLLNTGHAVRKALSLPLEFYSETYESKQLSFPLIDLFWTFLGYSGINCILRHERHT
ncbi:MAG: hypothetical protein ACE5OZ_01310 [Candidatus Heimdallarchaeota archaeon]